MSIEAALDADYATAWKPEPGDTLIGQVTEITERDGGYGVYPIVTVKRDDGEELALHAYHTVAQNELAEQRPQIGERIGIKYVGRVAGKDAKGSYHAYRIKVDRPDGPSINWARYSDGHEPSEDNVVTADFTAPKPAADDPLPF